MKFNIFIFQFNIYISFSLLWSLICHWLVLILNEFLGGPYSKRLKSNTGSNIVLSSLSQTLTHGRLNFWVSSSSSPYFIFECKFTFKCLLPSVCPKCSPFLFSPFLNFPLCLFCCNPSGIESFPPQNLFCTSKAEEPLCLANWHQHIPFRLNLSSLHILHIKWGPTQISPCVYHDRCFHALLC